MTNSRYLMCSLMTKLNSISAKNYTYELPAEKIAKHPVSPRDKSKLLVYKNDEISVKNFEDLSAEIAEGSTMVFNNTKVLHARLIFEKDSGGKIEIFCLQPGHQKTWVTALNTTSEIEMECLIGGISKWKNGPLKKIVEWNDHSIELVACYIDDTSNGKLVRLTWNDATLPLHILLELAGEIPLPPYLQRRAEKEDDANYQTQYAVHDGSVAAPTAGLHFTERTFDDLEKKKIKKTFITLHVGAGTFKPIKTETIEEHEMHNEWICITKKQVNELLDTKQIIAVGTTSLRHLESIYWLGVLLSHSPNNLSTLHIHQWLPYQSQSTLTKNEALLIVLNTMEKEQLDEFYTTTQLMIVPGYTFRMVNALITNFHQPGSTLLLLVAAAIGDNWKKIYAYALQHNFRFLSYGDSSLLWIK